MDPITRLQAYLRHSARHQYSALAIPPFTLFFHPSTTFQFFNYAIPDEPIGEDLLLMLDVVKDLFIERGRKPRFEFIEEYAPKLGPALEQADFVLEGRFPLMVCTPETIQNAPPVAGLTISELIAEETKPSVARAFLATQRQAFAPDADPEVQEHEIDNFLERLSLNTHFLARLDGEPVSAGVYTEPYDGVTEIAGIGTLPAFRRRGIAAALVEQAVRTAFARGVEIACLSAGDERAGRVYERVGFRAMATMLAYSVPGE